MLHTQARSGKQSLNERFALRNFRIGIRLAIGFGSILFILLAMAGIDRLLNFYSKQELINGLRVAQKKNDLAVAMKGAMYQADIAARNLGLVTDVTSMEREYKNVQQQRTHFIENRARFLALPFTPEEQRIFDELNHIDEQLHEPMKMAISQAFGFDQEGAARILATRVDPLNQRAIKEINRLVEFQQRTMDDVLSKYEMDDSKLKLLLVLCCTMALTIGGVLAWVITASIIKPLQSAVEIATDVAAGKLSPSVPCAGNDELTELMQALKEMIICISVAQEHLREAARSERLAALGSMVAGVAHELNTPIGNSLVVATHLIDSSNKVSDAIKIGLKRSTFEQYMDDVSQSSDILRRNLNKAAELISGFKQVAVDQTSVRRRQFDLAEMVAEIVMALGPAMRKKPYVVEQMIPEGIQLDSYPGPLGQILTNLINNAVLHGFDGQGEGTIKLCASSDSDSGNVTISVIDNGRGIPQEVLPRVFDPFFTTKLGAGGSGLGLHICHHLATTVLGGHIEVQSSIGAGTCFTLVLPCQAPIMTQVG